MAQPDVVLDKEDIALIIRTLGFYADPETYFAIGLINDDPCGPFIDDGNDTYLGDKPGKKAREVLIYLHKKYLKMDVI